MKRAFITDNPRHDWLAVTIVDTDTGDILYYNEDREHGNHFCVHAQNAINTGWETPDAYIKDHLASRFCNTAPTRIYEDDYEKRMVRERLKLIRYGAWLRLQSLSSRNENAKQRREKQFNNLCAYMKRYGLDESEAKRLMSM